MEQRKALKPLPSAETSWTVDPLSDLVSATELAVWRRDQTTAKVLRYLTRWRAQLVDSLAEGNSLEQSVEASAMRTTEYVAKAQLLRDILTLEARDIAEFYSMAEPKERS